MKSRRKSIRRRIVHDLARAGYPTADIATGLGVTERYVLELAAELRTEADRVRRESAALAACRA